jgi:hypothetical protein
MRQALQPALASAEALRKYVDARLAIRNEG